METILERIQNITFPIYFILMYLLILVLLLQSKAVRESFERIIKLFFLRDTITEKDLKSEVNELKTEIQLLKNQIDSKLFENEAIKIQSLVSNFIGNNLTNIITDHLNETKANSVKMAIYKNLKNTIIQETRNFLKKLNRNGISSGIIANTETKLKEEANIELIKTLHQETRSAMGLRTIMTNLFVLITLAFVFFNIYVKPETWTQFLPTAIPYTSLAAFFYYIIRISHNRTKLLLAIREQSSNYHNAITYIRNAEKANKRMTETDVEIIKLLLTNRSERESTTTHPYEILLKHVSGSNIQFKGGKLNIGNKEKIKE